MTRALSVLLLIVAIALHASLVLAQEKPTAGKEPAKSAADAEAMARWMAAATPGKEHDFLKRYVGQWKTATKLWMTPDSEPMESTGTSSATLILGSRFLRDEHKGTMMGMPFQGLGQTGYDNFKKRFVGTWCDNFGTCILTMQGSLDSTGKVLTLYGTTDDPATQERDKLIKYVTRFVGDDKYVFQIFDLSVGDGQKMMEMTCTRER